MNNFLMSRIENHILKDMVYYLFSILEHPKNKCLPQTTPLKDLLILDDHQELKVLEILRCGGTLFF